MRRIPALLALFASLALLSCAGAPGREPLDNSDPAVTARIKQEFRTHPELNVQYLDLNVDAGAVTISGIVDSIDSREAIRNLVRDVPGVQQVVLNVLIRD